MGAAGAGGAGYSNPNEPEPSGYNNSPYMYQAGPGGNQPESNQRQAGFQQFSGQAYTLNWLIVLSIIPFHHVFNQILRPRVSCLPP